MRPLIPIDKIDRTKFEEVRVCGEYVALLFSDGTACVMRASGDDEDGIWHDTLLHVNRDNFSEMNDLGVIDDDECKTWFEEYRKFSAARDRQEYERLKKLFEGE